MRNRILAIGGLVTLLGTSTAFGVLAQQGGAPNPPPSPAGRRRNEKHPELRMALRALERAKMALQRGAHDFSGHREKALDLTQKAIDEVKEALQSDKK